MIFKLFQEKGSIKRYLKNKQPPVNLLELDFDKSRVEVVEEVEPVKGDLPFLGDIYLPQRVSLISIPVGGNIDLLFYSPRKGFMVRCIDGLLEDDMLILKSSNEDPSVLENYVRELVSLVNDDVSAFNKKYI